MREGDEHVDYPSASAGGNHYFIVFNYIQIPLLPWEEKRYSQPISPEKSKLEYFKRILTSY
jgi:hypothetical protein